MTPLSKEVWNLWPPLPERFGIYDLSEGMWNPRPPFQRGLESMTPPPPYSRAESAISFPQNRQGIYDPPIYQRGCGFYDPPIRGGVQTMTPLLEGVWNL